MGSSFCPSWLGVNPSGLDHLSEDGLRWTRLINIAYHAKSLGEPGIGGMVGIQVGVAKDDWSRFDKVGLITQL